MIYQTEQDGKTDLMRVCSEPCAEHQRSSRKKREEEHPQPGWMPITMLISALHFCVTGLTHTLGY